MIIGIDAYFFANRENTGIGNYVISLMKELSKVDAENHYILYCPPGTEIPDFFFEIKNFTFKFIKGIFTKSRRLWLQSPSLRKQLLSDQIDIFFAGGEYCPVFLPKKIQIALTVHDLVYRLFPSTVSFQNRFFYHVLFPFCLKRADILFTVSENSKEEIHRFFPWKRGLIYAIPNGISLEEYLPEKDLKKESFILFVGTLQPRKNLKNLIQAYSMLAEKIPEKLVVVGASGWKNSCLSEILEKLPAIVRSKIDFKGYVQDSELKNLYRHARFCVLPSLHEGFGLPILESMASGTPVLTSPVGAIPELFDQAVEFCDPYSPENIAEQIQNLLAHPERLQILKENGLRVAQNYSLGKMAQNYLKAFQSIQERTFSKTS